MILKLDNEYDFEEIISFSQYLNYVTTKIQKTGNWYFTLYWEYFQYTGSIISYSIDIAHKINLVIICLQHFFSLN